MPCHNAITKELITVGPDATVEHVMEEMERANVSAVSVIDDETGAFLGLFSMKILLKNLIPVSVAMADGIQLDVKVGAAPGVAKRLANLKPLPVSEVMERKPKVVEPDSPLWEGVSNLIKNGGPLPIVDNHGKFYGIITYDSLVQELGNMNSSDD